MANKTPLNNSAFEELNNSAFDGLNSQKESDNNDVDNSAFEELNNSAFEGLSQDSEESKKKAQTEEVQEDTESVSEDGLLESQDTEEESLPNDFQPLPQGEDLKLGDEVAPLGLDEFYSEDLSEERKKEIEEVGKAQKEMEQKALYDRTKIELDQNLPDFDYLSKTTEDIIDDLPSEVDDNTAFQIIEEKKNEAVNELGRKDYERRLKLDETNFLSRGFSFEEARDLAKKRNDDLRLKEGIERIGLSDDELTEYREDIFNLKRLMDIPPKERSTQEKSEIIELLDKTSKLREDSTRQFINPETGKVDDVNQQAVIDLVPKYEKEAKTDFQKFSKRYNDEYNNIEALRHKILVSNLRDLPLEERGDANDRDRAELDKAMINFQALSRALLLNENPAAVSRGFEFLEGTWAEGIGSFATSFGESFVEAIPGAGNVTTDRDFRKSIVDIANKEGVKLSEEQYDSAVDGMSEKLGDTFGTSAEIMAEIMVTSLLTKNVSGALNVSDKLGRALAGMGAGKKTTRIAGETLKALEQAIAFDLTSQGSAAMGLGEFLGAKGGDKLLNILSKGKSGKLLKILKPLTRIMGATTAGTIEEYSGEYLDQAFRNGFLSKETFKNTFGRDYDEAKDKLLMTMILSGTFGTGAEFVNMYKLGKDYYSENGDETQLNDVEKAYQEIMKSKEQTAVKKFDDMTPEELEKYAKDNDIDLPELKKVIDEKREVLEEEVTTEDFVAERKIESKEEIEELKELEAFINKDTPQAESSEDIQVDTEEEVVSEETTTETEVTTEEEVESEVKKEDTPSEKKEEVSVPSSPKGRVETPGQVKEGKVGKELPTEETPYNVYQEDNGEVTLELNPDADLVFPMNNPDTYFDKEYILWTNKPEGMKGVAMIKKAVLDKDGNVVEQGEIKFIPEKEFRNEIRETEITQEPTNTVVVNEEESSVAEVSIEKEEAVTVSKEVISKTEGITSQPTKTKVKDQSSVSENGSYWAKDAAGIAYELEGSKPNEEVGLVQGFNAFGRRVYSPYKGEVGATVDVDSYKNKNGAFTNEELEQLRELKKELESSESENSSKFGSPFVNSNSDVVSTENVDENVSVLIKALKRALGMEGINIFITTDQDLNQGNFEKHGLFGDYSSIRSAKLSSSNTSEKGSTRKIKDGEHYIYIDSSLTPEQQAVVASHELGHILEKEVFSKASEEVKTKIKDEYNQWYASLVGKSVNEVLEETRDLSISDLLSLEKDRSFDPATDSYISSFKEWFADNVSKFATTNEKPKGVLQEFFFDLFNKLKNIYNSFKKKNKIFPEFDSWLESLFDAEKAAEVINEYKSDSAKKLSRQDKIDFLKEKGYSGDEIYEILADFERSRRKKGVVGKSRPKDTSEEIVTTEKKRLADYFRNQSKGSKIAEKSIKENQNVFKKNINEASKYLSEAKRKLALNLMTKVKDAESLRDAQNKLANLVEFGKLNPTKEEMVKTEPKSKEKFVTVSEKKLTERIIKAQNKAGKQVLKNKRSAFKELAKELGYKAIPSNISTRKAISLMRQLNSLDASKPEKVAEFKKRLEKVLSDKVSSDKKTNLKKRIKRLAKKARKRKGARNDIAQALNKINLNKVESLDKAEQLVDALEDSIKAKQSIKDKSISDGLVDAIRTLEAEQQATNEMLLEQAYENSDAKKYGLSFENFKEILEASEERKAELRKKQSEARVLKAKEELEKEFNNEVDKFNEYADEVTVSETSEDHVNRVEKLRESLNRIDPDSLTPDQMTDIYNAMEEAIALDSSAGLSKANAVLKAVKKAKNLSSWSNKGGKFKKPIYSIAEGLTTSWDSFATSVTKRIEDGFEFTAKILGEFDSKWNDTVEQSNKFNEGVDKILSRKKLGWTTEEGFSLDSSHKLGVISDFLQHETEMTSDEIQSEFDAKKKKLDAEIEYYDSLQDSKGLSRSEKRKYSKLSEKLKEARDIVSKYNTSEELQADLDNILTKGELELYNYALSEFEKTFEDFKNTHYAKNGKDVKQISNYIPTYKRNRKTGKGELEGSYDSSLSAKDSGRTVRRQPVKTDGSVLSNYDFISNIKNGMQDILYDVNTMESRMELDQLLKSKDYLEMFDKLPGLDKDIKQRLKVIFDARTPRPSTDSVMRNKFAEAAKSYYRGWKSSNLKNFTQLAKQYIPIMGSTTIETGVQNTAKGLSMSMSTDPKMKEYVDKIINLSALKNRVQLGDASFDASETLISKLLRNAYNSKGEGNAILNLYKRLNDDVMGASDRLAFKHSLLASYAQVMSKKGGVDITKEPSLEDVAKADALANTINNSSDPTKSGTFWQDRGFKPVRDLLFLYGSFAHNQTTQAFQALGNSVRYGDKKAVRKFVGAYVGMMTFYAIGDQLRDMLSSSSDYLFGDDDDKPLKGESGSSYKKRLMENRNKKEEEDKKNFIDYLKDYSKYAAADLALGTMPNVERDFIKEKINDSEIFGEDFFYVSDDMPGAYGGMIKDISKLIDDAEVAMSKDKSLQQKAPGFTRSFLGFLLQEGFSKRLPAKSASQQSRRLKKEKDLMDKRMKRGKYDPRKLMNK